MDCCQAAGIEEVMDASMAEGDLERYRKNGPDKSTRMLLEALTSEGVDGLTLLDIGGGVGVLQHELIRAGVGHVTSVDASSAYLEAAAAEAERQGHADRIRSFHADFVQIAGELTAADIVTLDRVICCYDDLPALVGGSVPLASRYYGVIYPRDHWWLKAFNWLENLYFRIRKSQFRGFVYPVEEVESLIAAHGLEPISNSKTLLWVVQVYRRNGASNGQSS